MSKKKEKVIKEEFKTNPVIELMDKTRDKYKSVLIVGINQDNKLDMDTTLGNYPAIHWLINRLLFKLNIQETNRENEGTTN